MCYEYFLTTHTSGPISYREFLFSYADSKVASLAFVGLSLAFAPHDARLS